MKNTLKKTNYYHNNINNNNNYYYYIIITIFIGLLWICNGEEYIEAKMEKSEKEGLYNVIQGFVGDSWNGSFLYPDPCGWTPIQGVSCDLQNELWYVTDLNIGPLHDNSLTCGNNPEFRPQLFEFKHLKSLSFYNCFNSGNLIAIPDDNWANLGSSLESLEFRSNPSLIGSIPNSFGELGNLQSLVIIENGISGNLSLSIGNLSKLKRLVLSGNQFTGRIIESIGDLGELLILDLSRNWLSGHIPFSIGYLKSLLKLDLSNNLLMGKIPENLGNLKNLTLLDLMNNSFSGGLSNSIEEMSSIQELILSSNRIGGSIRDIDWEKMKNLVILDVSNVGLSGEIPKSMTKLKNLRYLGLSNNNLTGNLPIELTNMASINSIYVDNNNLAGILDFPNRFYERLGRRFKAWNNPNLCYIGEVLMSSDFAPIGVDPCKKKTSDESPSIPESNPRSGSGSGSGSGSETGRVQEQLVWISSNSSFGLLKHGIINGIWFVYMLELFMMILLWSFIR